MKTTKIKCPSYFATPGAELFGVLNTSNEVVYLNTPLKIDKNFIEEADKNGDIEKRFRFTGKCVETKCQQWKDNQCSLSKLTLEHFESIEEKILPQCSIRKSCRWYIQEGETICYLCAQVSRL